MFLAILSKITKMSSHHKYRVITDYITLLRTSLKANELSILLSANLQSGQTIQNYNYGQNQKSRLTQIL